MTRNHTSKLLVLLLFCLPFISPQKAYADTFPQNLATFNTCTIPSKAFYPEQIISTSKFNPNEPDVVKSLSKPLVNALLKIGTTGCYYMLSDGSVLLVLATKSPIPYTNEQIYGTVAPKTPTANYINIDKHKGVFFSANGSSYAYLEQRVLLISSGVNSNIMTSALRYIVSS